MDCRRSGCGGKGSPAFTLLEMILVLALFGLIAGTVLVGGRAFLDPGNRDSAEQIAVEMVAQARHEAVAQSAVLTLTYDELKKQFHLGARTFSFAGEEHARLLPPARVASVLIGGRLVESTLSRARFYPDGTCDPFRIEITGGVGGSRILEIDPWTCAALAPEEKK